jgi:hypothetical protein
MIAELNQKTRVRDDGTRWAVEQREHGLSNEWRPTFSTPHRAELVAHLTPLVARKTLVEYEASLPAKHSSYREPRGTIGGIVNMVRQT